ncbi:TRAM domain-containing protein [Halorussus salinisoli]|uniref:TRAM domain-containing protein n=1 Tax=Halorussus salinisoli TaxID=2558242 RepID=UPI0010C2429E|nr:TRAM domain-containing protein [Halorussus salinisoli]
MDISENLHCLFSAEVDEYQDSYVIEIPKHEITNGTLTPDEVYRTALLSTTSADKAYDNALEEQPKTDTETRPRQDRGGSGPPVQEGDIREVDIDSLGDEGDGIARVERGYVIIVPDVEEGERVTIEITNVQDNVAFSEVVEREGHFE